MAITDKRELIVGARSIAGNPYDGHMLAGQLERAGILLENVGTWFAALPLDFTDVQSDPRRARR